MSRNRRPPRGQVVERSTLESASPSPSVMPVCSNPRCTRAVSVYVGGRNPSVEFLGEVAANGRGGHQGLFTPHERNSFFSTRTRSARLRSSKICRNSASICWATIELTLTENSMPTLRLSKDRNLGSTLVPSRFQTSGNTVPTSRRAVFWSPGVGFGLGPGPGSGSAMVTHLAPNWCSDHRSHV